IHLAGHPGHPGAVAHPARRGEVAPVGPSYVVGRVRGMTSSRTDGRSGGEVPPITITRHWQDHPAGSVLVEFGRTRVLCAASASTGGPRWGQGSRLGSGPRGDA